MASRDLTDHSGTLTVAVKRVYEPASKDDGYRVLVDRLWPRGITKDRAAIDRWEKSLAPSTELRRSFHTGEHSVDEFSSLYRHELDRDGLAAGRELIAITRQPLTLITAVRDVAQSHVPTLAGWLRELQQASDA